MIEENTITYHPRVDPTGRVVEDCDNAFFRRLWDGRKGRGERLAVGDERYLQRAKPSQYLIGRRITLHSVFTCGTDKLA